jgi:hypothetical protein
MNHLIYSLKNLVNPYNKEKKSQEDLYSFFIKLPNDLIDFIKNKTIKLLFYNDMKKLRLLNKHYNQMIIRKDKNIYSKINDKIFNMSCVYKISDYFLHNVYPEKTTKDIVIKLKDYYCEIKLKKSKKQLVKIKFYRCEDGLVLGSFYGNEGDIKNMKLVSPDSLYYNDEKIEKILSDIHYYKKLKLSTYKVIYKKINPTNNIDYLECYDKNRKSRLSDCYEKNKNNFFKIDNKSMKIMTDLF